MTEPEVKKEDIKNIEQQQEKKIVETKEEQPNIKTEENQANWKKFREEREKERQEKIKAQEIATQKQAEAEALKKAMEALLNKPQQQQQYDQYQEQEETEEQRIERKVQAALQKERQYYEEQRKKEESASFPQRLITSHPDFNQICTTENIDYFEYHYPEIATSFKHMPDGFDKWSSLYKTMKKLVPIQNKREDEKRIEKNTQKPQANVPNLTDTQPQTSGWRLTEERRKANWDRMRKDARSI